MSKAKKGDPNELQKHMTEENYRSWLSSFSDRQKVGEAMNTDNRPLANFMTEVTGHDTIVTPMRTHLQNVHFMNPAWAQAYIHEIDYYVTPNIITKTRALQVLDDLDWRFGDRMD